MGTDSPTRGLHKPACYHGDVLQPDNSYTLVESRNYSSPSILILSSVLLAVSVTASPFSRQSGIYNQAYEGWQSQLCQYCSKLVTTDKGHARGPVRGEPRGARRTQAPPPPLCIHVSTHASCGHTCQMSRIGGKPISRVGVLRTASEHPTWAEMD